VDISEPYTVTTSNQRKVAVFFYERDLSARVSFDPSATVDADRFVLDVLLPHYQPDKSKQGEAQLILIASDGELYGHHQSLRDHFLARLVNGASSRLLLSPVFLALWLKEHPPRQSVKICEGTSWSCHHGVTRWADSCDCTPGDSTWKAHLRHALLRLADALDQLYLDTAGYLFSDPWALRDRYIHVMLGEMTLEALLSEFLHWAPSSQQTQRIHLVLEAQRERQRMFTSCGWFFGEFNRIEPRNNVAYAAQAVYLARLATGIDLSPDIIADLRGVTNPDCGLGADEIFERHIQRAERVSKSQIGFISKT
jgi:hypothetical protein